MIYYKNVPDMQASYLQYMGLTSPLRSKKTFRNTCVTFTAATHIDSRSTTVFLR